MNEHEPKKLLILYILEIMRKHSDRNHFLTQKEIADLLKSEYGVAADRKTVRRNLSKLMEAGFPIRYQGGTMDAEEIKRKGKDGREQTILTNWFYNHSLEYGELSLLINSVLFADGLSKRYRTDLIRKIESLYSKHFHSVMKKIDMDIYGKSVNMEMLLTLENIQLAIADGKQLQFQYCDLGTDFNPQLREEDGKVRIYTVSPYQIIAKEGHQYLICNIDKYDDLTHFRIDRIKESQPTKIPSRPLRILRGFENGLRLSEYLKEHPKVWSGETRQITFRCHKNMMNDVADSFGTELDITQQPDDLILVHVHAGVDDVRLWAIQFADEIEVLSPQSLREQIAETLRNALKKYDK